MTLIERFPPSTLQWATASSMCVLCGREIYVATRAQRICVDKDGHHAHEACVFGHQELIGRRA